MLVARSSRGEYNNTEGQLEEVLHKYIRTTFCSHLVSSLKRFAADNSVLHLSHFFSHKIMKSFLTICLLIGVIQVSQSMVCPKHFCETVDCSNAPTEGQCSNGVIKEKGSFCGCCPICLKYIPIEGSCASIYLRGTPRTSTCTPPSECIEGVCTLPTDKESAPQDLSDIEGLNGNVEPAQEALSAE